MTSKRHLKNVPDTLFKLPIFPENPQLRGAKGSSAMQQIARIDSAKLKFSVKKAEQTLIKKDTQEWLHLGKQRAFHLFHAAAAFVPAYKNFLSKNGVNPGKIKSLQDFEKIPVIDKDSYLRQYPLHELVWHGRLQDSHMMVASSGSYGTPYIWPRSHLAEAESLLAHELSMMTQFDLAKKRTLVVVCFAMGMHIAGTITMQAIIQMSKKGYPITVITPGYSAESVLSIFPILAPNFDQVVLAGYPPFLKEIIDRGIAAGMSWSDYKVRLLMAGEGFNETWRDYVADLIGADPNKDFQNVYGSADAAAMGFETTHSIAFRRALVRNQESVRPLFGTERVPYLYQFYPEQKYFEAIDGELVLSASAGIPLIRYNIHDEGGITTGEEIEQSLGISEAGGKGSKNKWNLPFVFVYGRSNQMVVLYGANIYLEHIRQALEHPSIRNKFSGKVIMRTESDERQNDTFSLDVECAKGIRTSSGLQRLLKNHVVETLLEVNSEFKVILQGIGEKVLPQVALYPYGDERFHPKQMKHKWTNTEKE